MSTTALILAAGVGSRLAPITRYTPKPLVPFLGVATLEIAARQLVQAGVSRIAVNAFHLADKVEDFIDSRLRPSLPSVRWNLSREATLAGTGGAVSLLKDWLQQDSAGFWLANSDAVHSADLAAMQTHHEARSAQATMLVTRTGSFDVPRNVELDEAGHFRRLVPAAEVTPTAVSQRVAYCGWMRVAPGLADVLPPPTRASCSIRQGLIPWQQAGALVTGFETAAFSADLGTPERYIQAHRAGLESLDVLAATGAFPEGY